MAHKKSAIRHPRPRRGYVPPLPHPSWRVNGVQAVGGATAAVATATDFWDRLGL